MPDVGGTSSQTEELDVPLVTLHTPHPFLGFLESNLKDHLVTIEDKHCKEIKAQETIDIGLREVEWELEKVQVIDCVSQLALAKTMVALEAALATQDISLTQERELTHELSMSLHWSRELIHRLNAEMGTLRVSLIEEYKYFIDCTLEGLS